MGRLKTMPPRLQMLRPRLRVAAKQADRFYSSSEWKALVARRKLDSDYFLARSRAKPGERMILDHVIERKDGGRDLDPANTQWLTKTEHEVKTAKARARRARGEAR